MSSYNRILRLTSRALTVTGLALATSAFRPGPGHSPGFACGAACCSRHMFVLRGSFVRVWLLPAYRGPLSDIQTEAVFPVEGSPDWSVATKDSVWVASARANHVVQLIPATNKVGLIADVQRPCSGLADGFGSIWVPSCSTHTLLRIDPATGKPIAEIPADPSNSEGGITVGAGSVWMVTKPSALIRIDPKTNAVTATVQLPSGSDNPTFGDGFVWVSSFEHDQLLEGRSNFRILLLPRFRLGRSLGS